MDDSNPKDRKKPEVLDYSARRGSSLLPRQWVNLVLSTICLFYIPICFAINSLGFSGFRSGMPRGPIDDLGCQIFIAILSYESIFALIEWFDRPHGRIERVSLGFVLLFWAIVVLLFLSSVIRNG